MTKRTLLWAAFFAATAGAIAWGVLSDAREGALREARSTLESIQNADATLSYTGTRRLSGLENATYRVSSNAGRRRVEAAPSRGATSALGGFLRPGQGNWRRLVKDAGAALRNYEFVRSGRDTVAGREAEVIELRALHAGRASYRISADRENHFPLRFQVWSGGGVLFEASFEDIRFTAPAERAPEPPARALPVRIVSEAVAPEEIGPRVDYPVWLPGRLPAGFQLRRAEVVRAEVSDSLRKALGSVPFAQLDARVVHLNYTDGIALLSVVECSAQSELWKLVRRFVPESKTPAGDKVLVRKFADRRGSAFLMEVGGTAVVVAGNVPASEIEPILKTFTRQ